MFQKYHLKTHFITTLKFKQVLNQEDNLIYYMNTILNYIHKVIVKGRGTLPISFMISFQS